VAYVGTHTAQNPPTGGDDEFGRDTTGGLDTGSERGDVDENDNHPELLSGNCTTSWATHEAKRSTRSTNSKM